jgi:competence protein ComEA
MNSRLDSFMTRNEQKIVGFLAVSIIIGMFLYFTGISAIYADKTSPEEKELQQKALKDTIIVIDIRTASAEELELLPGIGPKRAQDIIAYRNQKQFESTQELLNIKGIGAKTYLAMKPSLLVFGKSGAGVTDNAKLEALQNPGTLTASSEKQELDETSGKIINEQNTEESKPVGKQGVININTASKEELMSLDGIGEVKAAAILEHRKQIGRFSSVEQLLDVKGIGPKTLEKNRHRLGL